MENKNTTTILLLIALIISIGIIWHILRKKKGIGKESSIIGTNTGSGSPTSTTSSTDTSTDTGTPPNSNQIILNKVTPVYYQLLPTQQGYPYTYSNTPVIGVTLPQGKVVTIVKKWQSQSGQGFFYETTELANTSLLNKVSPHLFIKESDL